MKRPGRSAVARWRAGLLHPTTRLGFDLLRDGGRRGSGFRVGSGLVLMATGAVTGVLNPPRRRIYQADLAVGESVGIRVVQNGEVVSETVVVGD